MACDLHTHSIYSDGTWTPEQLVEEAERRELTAIALTDHNTVAGMPRFLEAARGKRVQAVAGIEFSTDYNGMDLHTVALFVPETAFSQVESLMDEGKRRKEQSNRDLITALARAGYVLDYEKIRSATPNGQVNRAHIAAAMVEKGWVGSIQEAFPRFLDPACGYYVQPRRPDVFFIIDFIRSIGAVPVLAHPFLKLGEPELEAFLEKAVPAGLLAMETEYVSFSPDLRRRAGEIARNHGLLRSGGSDFHGDNKPGIFIGSGRGNLSVPDGFFTALSRAAGRK